VRDAVAKCMVRALTNGIEYPRQLNCMDFAHPIENGCLNLLIAGNAEGSEEKRWFSPSTA